MKNIVLRVITMMLFPLLTIAQSNLKKPLVLQMQDESYGGSNGAAVVWHPTQKKYIAALAGNTAYPLAVFDAAGKKLSVDEEQTKYDVRGLWFNPDKQQVQGNAYGSGGWFSYSITPTNSVVTKALFEGTHQPSDQSTGFYLLPLKRVAFLNGANITLFNTSNAEADEQLSFTLTPNLPNISYPDDLSESYNTTNAIYTAKPGYEIALLNVDNRQIEYYNLKTKKLSGISYIPDSVEELYAMFNFSYSNEYCWFYNKIKRTWTGYQLIIKQPEPSSKSSTTTVSNTNGPAKNTVNSADALKLYNEGITLKSEKNYSSAIVKMEAAIKADPNYADAYYQLGWIQNEIGVYSKAIDISGKAIALFPNDHRFYQEKGFALKMSGKYNEAIPVLNKSISIKNSSLALFDLADCYRLTGNKELALENYLKCLQIEPKKAAASFEVAYYYNSINKYAEALPYAQQAVLNNDKNITYHNELGFTYYKLKRNDDAINEYKKAVAIDETKFTAFKGMGDVYRVGYTPARIPEAVENYQKAVAKDNTNMGAAYGLGWCYNSQQKYDDAIAVFEKALNNDRKYKLILTEMGYSFYAKKNYSTAISLLKESIAVDNNQKLAHYYCGLCYVAIKDKSSATNSYHQLKNIDADLAAKLLSNINTL